MLYFQYLWKYSLKSPGLKLPFCFSALFVNILTVEYCEYQRSLFSSIAFEWAYDELCTTILHFRPKYNVRWPFGGWGTKTQRRASIFGQRVSSMTAHLIIACQLAQPKMYFFGGEGGHSSLLPIRHNRENDDKQYFHVLLSTFTAVTVSTARLKIRCMEWSINVKPFVQIFHTHSLAENFDITSMVRLGMALTWLCRRHGM